MSQDEWDTLEPVITKWEDKQALVAEDLGLSAIKTIISKAPERLTKNKALTTHHIPQLVIEIGAGQALEVSTLMKNAGFSTTVHQDAADKDRLVCGELL